MSGRRSRFQVKPKIASVARNEPTKPSISVPETPSAPDVPSLKSQEPVVKPCEPSVESVISLEQPSLSTTSVPECVVDTESVAIAKKINSGDGGEAKNPVNPGLGARRARFKIKPQICKPSTNVTPVESQPCESIEKVVPPKETPVNSVPILTPEIPKIPQPQVLTIATEHCVIRAEISPPNVPKNIESGDNSANPVEALASPVVLPACTPVDIKTQEIHKNVDIANLNDFVDSEEYNSLFEENSSGKSELRTRSGRVSKPRPNTKADQVWKSVTPKRSRTESTKSSSSSSKRMSGHEEIDRSTFTMADLIKFNPKNPEAMLGKDELLPPFKKIKKCKKATYDDPTWKQALQLDMKQESQQSKYVAPQLKIGTDGNLIVDETSMVVQSETEKKVFERVADTNQRITSMSFFKRQLNKTRLWSEQETEMFYRLLPATGTDFWLMSEFFPKRNRTELKNKFKREQKKFPHKIKDAMSKPCLLDPRVFDLAPGKGQKRKKVKLEKRIHSNIDPEEENGDDAGNSESESESERTTVNEGRSKEIQVMKEWQENDMAGRTETQVREQFEVPSRYGRVRKLRDEAVQAYAACSSGTNDQVDEKKPRTFAEKLVETAEKVAGKSISNDTCVKSRKRNITHVNIDCDSDEASTSTSAKFDNDPTRKFKAFVPSCKNTAQNVIKGLVSSSTPLNLEDILPPDLLSDIIDQAKNSRDGNLVIKLSDDSNEELVLAIEKSKVPGKADMLHFYKMTKHNNTNAGSSSGAAVKTWSGCQELPEEEIDIVT